MSYNTITIHFQNGFPKEEQVLKQLKQLFQDQEKQKQPLKDKEKEKNKKEKIKKRYHKQKKYKTYLANSIEKLPNNIVKELFKNEIKNNETIYTIIPNNDRPYDSLLLYRADPERKKIKTKIKQIENTISVLNKKPNKLEKLNTQLNTSNEELKKYPIWNKAVKLNVFFAKDQNGNLRNLPEKNICRISRAGKKNDLKRWIEYTEKYNPNTVYNYSIKETYYCDSQNKTPIYKGIIYQKYLQQNLDDYFLEDKTLEKKLEIFLKIIAKLKKMHKNLDIHSDLKPANIMIDEYDEIHIIDFEMTCNMNDEKNKELCQNRIENAREDNYVFFPLPILNGTEKKRSKQFDISSLGVTFWLILGGEKEDYEYILKKYRNKPDIKEQKKEIDKLIKDSLSAKKIDKNIIKYIQKMIYIDPKKCPTLEKVEENFELTYQEEKQRKIIRNEVKTCFKNVNERIEKEKEKQKKYITYITQKDKFIKNLSEKNTYEDVIKRIKQTANDRNQAMQKNINKIKNNNTKKPKSGKPYLGFNPQATFIAGSRAINPNPNQIILCYAIAASIVTLSFGFYMIKTLLNTLKLNTTKNVSTKHSFSLSRKFNSIVKSLRRA
ncbi:MAG: protein kinase [Gammaproteobacteria bacterium]|jgi:serine/threonine protein kinase